MKKVLCCVLLALALVLQLSGCTDEKLLYQNDSVIISRAGRVIAVEDIAANQTYTLRIRRTRERKEGKKLMIDIPTISIETEEGRLIVTDKSDSLIITIRL